MGVKAAAAAKAREDEELERAQSDSYWGTLFGRNDTGQPVAKELTSQLLKGIAQHIVRISTRYG